MESLTGTDTYWKLLGQCAECGKCTQTCPSLKNSGMSMGQIAEGLIAADAASSNPQELVQNIIGNAPLYQAVRGCFLCTSCQAVCFADNDISELIYAARKDFQELGLIPRDAWSSVQVDQEWDIFTAYRAIYGIGYPDLTRHIVNEYHEAESDCEVAFFPGCSLAAYGPELTREVFATIEQIGGKTTLIDECCGSPLRSAGFFDRAIALNDRIVDEIAASGAKTVVFACPGCRNSVKAALAARGLDVEAVNLASYLADHGFKPSKRVDPGSISLARSCQDHDGTYLDGIRKLFGLTGSDPTVFTGCCGAGGAVSAFDPNKQSSQVHRKLDQVAEGQTLVSACPTCTYTYAFDLMSAPRPIENKNYLELLFENQFDWNTVFYQLGAMWSGEYGPWLAQVFA